MLHGIPKSNKWRRMSSKREKLLDETIGWFQEKGAGYRRSGWRIGLLEKYVRGDTVDLGSGAGYTSRRLLAEGLINRLVLVDLADKPLGEAVRANNPRVIAVCGDIRDQLFREESFDTVLLYSTIHNIPGREYRRLVIRQACRYLRRGGHLVVLVWALLQLGFIRELITSLIRSLLSNWEFGDIIMQDKHGRRFYHLYRMKELLSDASSSGCRIIDSGAYYPRRKLFKPYKNLYAVAVKE